MPALTGALGEGIWSRMLPIYVTDLLRWHPHRYEPLEEGRSQVREPLKMRKMFVLTIV